MKAYFNTSLFSEVRKAHKQGHARDKIVSFIRFFNTFGADKGFYQTNNHRPLRLVRMIILYC